MSSLPTVNLSALFSATGSTSSGIDVASTVSQILAADRAPEQQWESQQQTIAQQSTALNQLNSEASSLVDSLSSLQDPLGALAAQDTTSTQASLVTATASGTAATGNHVIVVSNLASTASWYSGAVADGNTAFAAGGYELTVGTGSFQTTTTISIGNGVNTPNQLATYINGLKLGVTASVVTDSTGARVALVSNSSGSASDFSLSPDSGSSPSFFTRAATGTDASLTVDGIPITSATNTVTGAISGVTLFLNGQAPGTEVGVSVGPDVSQASQAINSFVSAYNSLVSQVNGQFAYDSTNQTSGPLASDSTVRMFQSELLAAPSYSGGGSVIATLGNLGITMNDDGTLTVDSSTLSSAIQNNPGAVQAFFQGASSDGFAANLTSALNTFADPSDGAFTVDLKSLSDENTDLQNQIDDLETYLSGVQTTLTNEYNQADIALQELPMQEQQINAILGNNSNSNGSNS